jgi:hypothetical protein
MCDLFSATLFIGEAVEKRRRGVGHAAATYVHLKRSFESVSIAA